MRIKPLPRLSDFSPSSGEAMHRRAAPSLFSPAGRRWRVAPDEGGFRRAPDMPHHPLIASHVLGTSPRCGEEGDRRAVTGTAEVLHLSGAKHHG